jgi:glycosyltransferase involved in cell wall biosynthesis
VKISLGANLMARWKVRGEATRGARAENLDQVVVAHISTYPPRECGIALYTKALVESMGSQRYVHLVLAVDDAKTGYQYDPSVRFVIKASNSASYTEAARFLNQSSASVVSLQHEYGIFGGEWGRYVLGLSSFLDKPLVTTFHTVLKKPPPLAKSILCELASASEYVVVTLKKAARLLVDTYGLPESKLRVIQHGAPPLSKGDPLIEKEQLGLSGRPIAVTVGFLSPAKGIEYGLRAMKTLLKEYPDLIYIVVGEIHPSLNREQGDAYWKTLENLKSHLGLAQSVRFVKRFVSEDELAMFLNIADVYIAPYRGRDQVSSGTLTRATASGKAIVATPTPFAKETFTPGRGLLCEFDNPQSIARQVRRILSSPSLRRRLEVRAKQYAARVGWQQTAEKYAKLFKKALEV